MRWKVFVRGALLVSGCVGFWIVLADFLPQAANFWPASQSAAAEEEKGKGKKDAKPKPKYVGVKMCRVCHKSPKEVWSRGRGCRAWE